jgi:hypothetical protein
MDSRQAARELEQVQRALIYTNLMLSGQDMTHAAINLSDAIHYTPLRTTVEQAQKTLGRVIEYLQIEASRR